MQGRIERLEESALTGEYTQGGGIRISGTIVLGPVAMVRMQKAGIKYKKPIVFHARAGAFNDDPSAATASWMGRGRSNFGAVGTGPVD